MAVLEIVYCLGIPDILRAAFIGLSEGHFGSFWEVSTAELVIVAWSVGAGRRLCQPRGHAFWPRTGLCCPPGEEAWLLKEIQWDLHKISPSELLWGKKDPDPLDVAEKDLTKCSRPSVFRVEEFASETESQALGQREKEVEVDVFPGASSQKYFDKI